MSKVPIKFFTPSYSTASVGISGELLKAKYGIDEEDLRKVFNKNVQVHAPWVALATPILVASGRAGFALPLTAKNTNRETFDKHLLKVGPALSTGVLHLLRSEQDKILAETKVLYDATKTKIDATAN